MAAEPEPIACNALCEASIPTEEQYLYCIRCGLCLSVCPTYRESLKETDSPRGRIAIVRKVAEGQLPLSRGVTGAMYSCLSCQACSAICPVGIKPATLAVDMRYAIHKGSPQPWIKKPIFHGYFPRPQLMELSMLPLRLYQRLGVQSAARRLGLRRLMLKQLQDMEQLLPEIPARPLRRTLPRVTPAVGVLRHRVAFFLGCFQSLLFADGSAAAVRVMARNGCEVVTPREVKCCGMPAAGYGDREMLLKLARHNIDLFLSQQADTIVTDCATCGSTLKEYARLLAADPAYAERARAFSSKVRDISEFLVGIGIEPPRAEVRCRVTYHDPCHLVRAQGVARQPRELMRMVPGLELVEMKEPDWCCGSAGTQLLTHYHASLAVNRHKMEHVRATGADVLATGCPGCQMQLAMGASHFGVSVRVLHTIQLLDEAYRREDQVARRGTPMSKGGAGERVPEVMEANAE